MTASERELANRLEALTAANERAIAAKDRVIVDQEQVIVGLERQLAGAVDRVAELEAELVKVRESRDAWRLQAMREHDAERGQ